MFTSSTWSEIRRQTWIGGWTESREFDAPNFQKGRIFYFLCSSTIQSKPRNAMDYARIAFMPPARAATSAVQDKRKGPLPMLPLHLPLWQQLISEKL